MNKKLALALLTVTRIAHAEVVNIQEPVAVETPGVTNKSSLICIDTNTLTPEELQSLKALLAQKRLLHIVGTTATSTTTPLLPELVPPVEPVVVGVIVPEVVEPTVEEGILAGEPEVVTPLTTVTPEVVTEEAVVPTTPEVVATPEVTLTEPTEPVVVTVEVPAAVPAEVIIEESAPAA